jgi:molybdate transport system substrate-binding protein
MAHRGEIRAISLPTFRNFLQRLSSHFEASGGPRLAVDYGWFSILKPKIDADAFDMAFSTAATTAYLAKEGRTDPASRTEFCRLGIGVAVRAGNLKPDIGSITALKRMLLDAKSISIPPAQSTTGNYLLGLLERLEVAGEAKSKLQISESGDDTAKAVAAGHAEIGLTLINEFVPVVGLDIVGRLPPELQNYLTGTAAVGMKAKDPEQAAAVIEYLSTSTAITLMNAEFMESLVRRP